MRAKAGLNRSILGAAGRCSHPPGAVKPPGAEAVRTVTGAALPAEQLDYQPSVSLVHGLAYQVTMQARTAGKAKKGNNRV